MKSSGRILLVIASVLLLGAQVTAGETIESVPYLQDWEDGTAGWYSKLGPEVDPILIVDDPVPYSGDWSQKVMRVDAASNYLSPLIEVTPGESYAVSAWINWESGGWPFVGISRYNEFESPIGLPLSNEPGTAPRLIWLIGQDGYHTKEGYDPPGGLVTPVPIVDGWHRYEKAFIVPTGTAYVRIMTELWKGASRDGDNPLAYFDDIAMHTVPHILFVEPPTPADGAIIEGTSVPIEVSIIGEMGSALVDVTFYWKGTDYWLYDDSLVLMFNFDKVAALGEDYTAANPLVKDVSGWGNDGYVGDEFGNKIPAWTSDGRYGGAFEFSGDGLSNGQSILVAHADSLNPYESDFAIVVWILPRNDYDGDILRKGSTKSGAGTWYKLEHSPSPNSNKISLNFNTNGTDATVTSAAAYDDEQWHFVVAQRTGSQAELWIDGVNKGTAFVSGSISNIANLAIGSKDTQDEDFLNSTVDEVRIYMRSFSPQEIQELYYSNLSKYNTGSWTLYVNQSGLAGGTHTYTYQASASDAQGTYLTEQRSVTVTAPEVTAQIIKGPYLQQVTSDSIVIMWETDVAVGSWVDYGLAGPGEFFVEDFTPVTIHEVQLTELASDTGYYYTVTSGGTTSPTSTFATAPAAERSFRFVAYGDTRTNAGAHAAVIQGIINTPGGLADLVIHTGDLVENGNEYGQWGTQFFGPAHALMINTPLLPVIGNHEGSGSLFRDFFSLGDNDDWFAFTYGGVRFIGLNTHNASYSPGSAQYTWLEAELQSEAYTNATWHIVYFHHPPYTWTESHKDDMNVQQDLVPLFEQYGVDMVFNGHSHAYERYFHNGIYYIVTGGGGAPLRNVINDKKEPIRQYGESVYHHCVIDVDVANSSLTLSARYNNGQEFDTITLTKTPKASNPSPADEATGVAVDADLSWTAGIDAVSHDVYFGTNPDPGPEEFKGNQTETSYDPPGTLAPSTTYYWRIDEFVDGTTTHTGDVWSFTTEGALLWIDGFESGGFTAGGWSTSSDASVKAAAAYSGSYGAQLKKSAAIVKTVSTVGYTNIYVKYARKTNAMVDGEFLAVKWFDGSTWHSLEETQDTEWAEQDWELDSDADENPDFQIRFVTNADKNNEYACIDDVEITGTPSGMSAGGMSTARTMHVDSIVVSYVELDYGIKKGLAEVVIVDNNGRAVTGATVTATFSEDISETLSAVTDGNGLAALETTKEAEGRCLLTITIVSVDHSVLIYEPSENVETRDNNRL